MFGTLGLPYDSAVRCLWQLMQLSTPKRPELRCSQMESVVRRGQFPGLKGIDFGSSLDHVAIAHGSLRPISVHLSQFWCFFVPCVQPQDTVWNKEVGILYIYIIYIYILYIYYILYICKCICICLCKWTPRFQKVYMWILIQAFIFAVIPWSTIRISGTPRVRATSHTASAMVMIFFSDPTKHTKVRSSVTCQGMFAVCEACWSSRVRATSTDPQQLCWILLGLNIFKTTGPELISA